MERSLFTLDHATYRLRRGLEGRFGAGIRVWGV
jgi:hypothetical protein